MNWPIHLLCLLLTQTTPDPFPAGLAKVIGAQVLDGDTIRCELDLGWDVRLANQTIRASGYDAWEASRKRKTVVVTDAEIAKGRAAAAALEALLDRGEAYASPVGDGYSVYNRREARLWIRTEAGEWIDVALEMERGRHVRPAKHPKEEK